MERLLALVLCLALLAGCAGPRPPQASPPPAPSSSPAATASVPVEDLDIAVPELELAPEGLPALPDDIAVDLPPMMLPAPEPGFGNLSVEDVAAPASLPPMDLGGAGDIGSMPLPSGGNATGGAAMPSMDCGSYAWPPDCAWVPAGPGRDLCTRCTGG